MGRRGWILASLVVAAGASWYLFRPERLFVSTTVSEQFPETEVASASTDAEASILLRGRFHSNAHETQGLATLYRLADGRVVLRLTEFETSNGPDVQIYLVAAQDVADNETVSRSGFISLGPMKGNVGDQNYDVPAEIDLAKYRAVTVWCRRFKVNFGTAPLS